RLGTLVASPNFRHPVPFARELLTLDNLSGGRLTVGLGAGGSGWDASVLGHAEWSPRERADRFEEFVGLLDRLLREPVVTATGEHYRADGARNHAGCVQQPRVPFAVAATGPRGMRLAAALADTWVTNGDRAHDGPPLAAADGAAVVARQVRRLEEACAEVGRDPASLAKLVLTGPRLASGLESPAEFAETATRYEDVGITDLVVHWPRADEPYAGDEAWLEWVGRPRG
ncbi:MAG TPA: LLM class flavin-dependent oxidoreductase, partial [Acidimicrobiales bacterium]|nr:LLM class flavin-dependent oxidoreductase [Acidimicrobiales bacterium]